MNAAASDTSPPRIRAEDLAFTPAGRGEPLFADVTLAIRPGERVGIVGPSGSGKTTLGYHLCGAHRLALAGTASGRLEFDGRDGLGGAPAGFAGLVAQNPEAQLFCETLAEEVTLGLRARGVAETACEATTGGLLGRYGLERLRHARVAALSLGQKQLVAVLSMLAIVPRVLVLDEPTSYLDAAASDRLFAHLDALCREEGWVALVIEHDLDRLAGFADRFLAMDNGRLVYDGPSATFPRRPAMPRPPCPAPAPDAAPLLRFRGVRFGYGGDAPVLDGLDLDLRPGEVVALSGGNGAGKTTALRLAKGLGKPAAGSLEPAPGLSPGRDVGLMLQNPDAQIFAHTVEAECAYWPTNLGLPADVVAERTRAALESLGIGHLAGRSPFTLSFGEKRRLCLAAVLAGEPAVLCLDEPTTGLDEASMAVMAAVVRAQAATGRAVLLATHDRDFARAVATRRLRLQGGRLVGETAP